MASTPTGKSENVTMNDKELDITYIVGLPPETAYRLKSDQVLQVKLLEFLRKDYRGKKSTTADYDTNGHAQIEQYPVLDSNVYDTEFVKVTHLPELFVKEHFKSWLNMKLWSAGVLEKGTVGVLCVVAYNEANATAQIECTSAEIAAKLCGLQPLKYEKSTIRMFQVQGTNCEQEYQEDVDLQKIPTAFVNVENLPELFVPEHFRRWLDMELWSGQVLEKGTIGVVCVTDYNEASSTAQIECTSADIATLLCGLQPLHYEKSLISLLQVQKTNCEQDSQQHVDLQKIPTKFVNVENLPEIFVPEHFRRWLDMELWSGQVLEKGTIGVVCVTDYNEARSTAQIECTSADVATLLCGLQPLHYGKSKISLLQVQKTNYEKGSEQHVDLQTIPTEFVRVENLPELFVHEHFTRSLDMELWSGRVLEKGTFGVLCVLDYNEASATARIECTSADIAALLCSLQPLEYGGSNIRMVQEVKTGGSSITGSENSQADVSCTPVYLLVADLPHFFNEAIFIEILNRCLWGSGLLDVSKSAVLGVENVGAAKKTVRVQVVSTEVANKLCTSLVTYSGNTLKIARELLPPGSNSVGQPHGTNEPQVDVKDMLAFVKVLVRTRHMFQRKNHNTALVQIHNDLAANGMDWSLPFVQKKRKALLDTYVRKKKSGLTSWQYYKPCAVIKGDAGLLTLECTEFSDSPPKSANIAENLQQYTKGAVWSDKATRKLLAFCIKNRHMYKNLLHKDRFFKQASAFLVQNNFLFSPDQWESKMSALEKFKDEEEILNKSGAPVEDSNFPYHSQMLLLSGDDVAVKPIMTTACGSSSEVHSRDDKENAYTRNRRERSPVLKKPRTFQEQKVNILQTLTNVLVKKYGV